MFARDTVLQGLSRGQAVKVCDASTGRFLTRLRGAVESHVCGRWSRCVVDRGGPLQSALAVALARSV